MSGKMQTLAFAILIVAGLAIFTTADEEIKCTREGAICLNCTTLAYCKQNTPGKLDFTLTNPENCVVGFVCDEWTLQCERGGICRYTPFSCPTIEDKLVPDPYSCTGYYSCAEAFPYQCGDGKIFSNGTCEDYHEDPICNDYPVLCEKAGQITKIAGFTYLCKEEVINNQHVIHPVVQEPLP